MAIKSTITTLWRNRRHFKLQIFGIMVLFTVSVFIINLITIKVGYDSKLAAYTASTAKYTSKFQMSLSGVRGTIDKIYVDSSKTQCFILASFESTSSITVMANDYQMLLTNVNNSGKSTGEPKEKLSGEIYMFGSSGIVGMYIKSDKPFDNTLRHLVLRSYKKYTANTSPYYKTISSDAKYDQCHIYFNPGATGTKSIDFLEKHVAGTTFDLTEIYRQVSTVTDEIKQRDEILAFYDDLMTTMNKIVEYQKRLSDSYNVEIPELPDCIKGDYFDNIVVYDAEGVETGSYKKYVPATIVPGGTEYDWYNGSVLTGYFKLVPNIKNMTIRDYVYALRTDKDSREAPDVKIKVWYYKDGNEVRMVTDSTTTSLEKEVINNINNYQELLKNYLKLKTQYQTDYLPALLLLENDSGSVGQTYSVRNDAEAILVY